jgi:hypothetical protein
MQHAFNFPLQLGTHSRDEPMKDAMRFEVGVERGDLVVLGSDGLMDNLVSGLGQIFRYLFVLSHNAMMEVSQSA